MSLLVRPEPVSTEFNRLFNSLWEQPVASQRWVPEMDLVETDDHYLLKADLPGMKQEDVAIEFNDGALTISGERKAEQTENKEGYHRVERAFGSFSRSLTLPEGVNAEAIAATFDRGVLEVSIPKPEERKPRKISVGVGSQPKTIETESNE